MHKKKGGHYDHQLIIMYCRIRSLQKESDLRRHVYLETDSLVVLGLPPDDDNANGREDAKQSHYSETYRLPLHDVVLPRDQHYTKQSEKHTYIERGREFQKPLFLQIASFLKKYASDTESVRYSTERQKMFQCNFMPHNIHYIVKHIRSPAFTHT